MQKLGHVASDEKNRLLALDHELQTHRANELAILEAQARTLEELELKFSYAEEIINGYTH